MPNTTTGTSLWSSLRRNGRRIRRYSIRRRNDYRKIAYWFVALNFAAGVWLVYGMIVAEYRRRRERCRRPLIWLNRTGFFTFVSLCDRETKE
jgi:hypothetical protein